MKQIVNEDENKFSEILKGYTFEQLVYAKAINNKQKTDIYIQEKEIDAEFKRRLEER